MQTTLRLAIGSVVVGIVVLGLKTLAWWWTGSVALLSDALESTVNVATALAALVAIRVAARPADDNHPYGHDKAEYFSAVLEGVMIVVAALLIVREAVAGFADPPEISAPLPGLAVFGLATVVNLVWARVLIGRGGAEGSPALVADGRHLMTDVVTSGGVLVAIGLVLATGWLWLDPAIALVVAANILWSGAKVVRQSLSGLMDEAVPDRVLEGVREAIAAGAAGGAVEAHDLRTRQAASRTFVEFHLVVPSGMSVLDAHEICDRIEADLRDRLGEASITIHVEPEHKSKDSAEAGVILPEG